MESGCPDWGPSSSAMWQTDSKPASLSQKNGHCILINRGQFENALTQRSLALQPRAPQSFQAKASPSGTRWHENLPTCFDGSLSSIKFWIGLADESSRLSSSSNQILPISQFSCTDCRRDGGDPRARKWLWQAHSCNTAFLVSSRHSQTMRRPQCPRAGALLAHPTLGPPHATRFKDSACSKTVDLMSTKFFSWIRCTPRKFGARRAADQKQCRQCGFWTLPWIASPQLLLFWRANGLQKQREDAPNDDSKHAMAHTFHWRRHQYILNSRPMLCHYREGGNGLFGVATHWGLWQAFRGHVVLSEVPRVEMKSTECRVAVFFSPFPPAEDPPFRRTHTHTSEGASGWVHSVSVVGGLSRGVPYAPCTFLHAPPQIAL